MGGELIDVRDAPQNERAPTRVDALDCQPKND